MGNQRRLRQAEQVVVAALVLRQVEAAAVIRLLQAMVLELGAERSIGDEDSLGRFGAE